MKRNYLTAFLPALLLIVLLSSCESKEKKALKLIDHYMKTTLIDYESYEVNEIKIDSAYNQLYMDDKVIEYANVFQSAEEKYDEASKECESNIESMHIWSPGYYSSSYERHKFKEASDLADENIKAMNDYIKIMREAADSIKAYGKTFKSEFIGWGCSLNYRCKTAGGMRTLNNGYFVVDRKCKKLLYSAADINDDDYTEIIHNIDRIISGKWDESSD